MSRNYSKRNEQKDQKREFSRDERKSPKKGRRNGNKKDNPDDKIENKGWDNDPNYYFVSKELAEQCSQLSFQSILGQGTLHGYEVPTVVIVSDCMNPGVTENVRDAVSSNPIAPVTSVTHLGNRVDGKAGVNVMAAKLYTFMSSFTGRTSNYAPQDVAMMILAISAIVELSEHIRRFFGLLLTYNFRNRMVPLYLIKLLGCDPDDLKKNISDYRMRFNVAMSRMNQIPLLGNIAFIDKCRGRYQKIYQDDPTSMSQLWAYVPTFYYILDEVGDTDGSVLRAKWLRQSASDTNMNSLLTKLEDMITAVLESTSLNLIYADMLNMANKIKVKTWQFDYLAENYVVMPEYNAGANLQFHNLTVMGMPGASSTSYEDTINQQKYTYTDSVTGRVTYITGGASIFCDANKNNIVYNPLFSGKSYALCKYFVDLPIDNPDMPTRIESLRNVSLHSASDVKPSDLTPTISGVGTGNILTCAALTDHFVTKIFVASNSGNLSDAKSMEDSIYSGQSSYPINKSTQISNFPCYIKGTSIYTDVVGSLQYYTEIDYKYIKRLLDAMSIGLFEFRTT